MRKFIVLLVALSALSFLLSGCKSSDSGSREFVPGKGWRPV